MKKLKILKEKENAHISIYNFWKRRKTEVVEKKIKEKQIN